MQVYSSCLLIVDYHITSPNTRHRVDTITHTDRKSIHFSQNTHIVNQPWVEYPIASLKAQQTPTETQNHSCRSFRQLHQGRKRRLLPIASNAASLYRVHLPPNALLVGSQRDLRALRSVRLIITTRNQPSLVEQRSFISGMLVVPKCAR